MATTANGFWNEPFFFSFSVAVFLKWKKVSRTLRTVSKTRLLLTLLMSRAYNTWLVRFMFLFFVTIVEQKFHYIFLWSTAIFIWNDERNLGRANSPLCGGYINNNGRLPPYPSGSLSSHVAPNTNEAPSCRILFTDNHNQEASALNS